MKSTATSPWDTFCPLFSFNECSGYSNCEWGGASQDLDCTPLASRSLIKQDWNCGDNNALLTGSQETGKTLDDCDNMCNADE